MISRQLRRLQIFHKFLSYSNRQQSIEMAQQLRSSSGYQDYGSTADVVVVVGTFRATAFVSMIENVAQVIGNVKSAFLRLEKSLKIIGSPRDSQEKRNSIHDLQKDINHKIAMAGDDLSRLARMVRSGGEKQHRLQVDKLTGEFELIVKKYIQSQERIATKMKATILPAVDQDEAQAGPYDREAEQQQTQVQSQLLERGMALRRENEIRKIESVILDVNQIMISISNKINAQGQMIDSIESNIESVHDNVESGAQQLVKAQASQNKYRRKVLILLLIAVIFGTIVTAIVVSSIQK